MKKCGHLNRDVSRVLARMGHTDSLVIGDCGLPVPDGVECIDLSIAFGDPSFLRVLDSVLTDFKVERAVFAIEAKEHNAAVAARASRKASTGRGLALSTGGSSGAVKARGGGGVCRSRIGGLV
jgi:D-ribose pyranase